MLRFSFIWEYAFCQTNLSVDVNQVAAGLR